MIKFDKVWRPTCVADCWPWCLDFLWRQFGLWLDSLEGVIYQCLVLVLWNAHDHIFGRFSLKRKVLVWSVVPGALTLASFSVWTYKQMTWILASIVGGVSDIWNNWNYTVFMENFPYMLSLMAAGFTVKLFLGIKLIV